MSFLNNIDSKFLSVRITKKGRNAIAKGDFKISFGILISSNTGFCLAIYLS
jgi:hypothetical protein